MRKNLLFRFPFKKTLWVTPSLFLDIQTAIDDMVPPTTKNPNKLICIRRDNQLFQSKAHKPRDLFSSPRPLIETISRRSPLEYLQLRSSTCQSVWFYLLVSHASNLPSDFVGRWGWGWGQRPTWERWISRPAALSKICASDVFFACLACLLVCRAHVCGREITAAEDLSLSPSSPLILRALM